MYPNVPLFQCPWVFFEIYSSPGHSLPYLSERQALFLGMLMMIWHQSIVFASDTEFPCIAFRRPTPCFIGWGA